MKNGTYLSNMLSPWGLVTWLQHYIWPIHVLMHAIGWDEQHHIWVFPHMCGYMYLGVYLCVHWSLGRSVCVSVYMSVTYVMERSLSTFTTLKVYIGVYLSYICPKLTAAYLTWLMCVFPGYFLYMWCASYGSMYRYMCYVCLSGCAHVGSRVYTYVM
jgi:hypothetical protein